MTVTQLPPAPPLVERRRTPRGTVSAVAADSVAHLVHWLVILMLLGQAVTSVLRPPQGLFSLGVVQGLICLVWATFALGMGMLRGKYPDRSDRPLPGWLSAVAAAGCLISLEVMREAAGLPTLLPAQLLTAGLLVASLTIWGGPVLGGVSATLLGGLAMLTPLQGDAEDPLLRTTLTGAVPAVGLVAAGFSVAVAIVALRRAAVGLQRSLDRRAEALMREQAVRVSAQVAAEVERSLHDTALNTLETVAAHGDHLDPADVAARCRADSEQLTAWRSEAGHADLLAVQARLDGHAQRLGLTLEPAIVAPPSSEPPGQRIPSPVLVAITGAATEALTNIAKHAQVTRASMLTVIDDEHIQVFIADEGVGSDSAAMGYGTSHSINDRMRGVGGNAMTGPGPDGVGTVVLLEWQRDPPEELELGSDLLVRTARIVLMMGTFLAGLAAALVVLGWPAYEQPWIALAAVLAPVLVGAVIVERAVARVRVGASYVLIACATYVLVSAALLAADPYCSSLAGESAAFDARVPMMAIVLMLAPRPAVLASVIATVGASHVGSAMAWHDTWQLCGPATAEVGVYVVAILGAVSLFVERIQRLTRELAGARAQEQAAQRRMVRQLAIRTEEELWVADTLGSAQELLDDLASGRRDPRRPAIRALCGTEAGFLRALLAVSQAPADLRRSARIWLRLLHLHGCRVRVRGAIAECLPVPEVIGEVGGAVDAICAVAPGSEVTLMAWPEEAGMSLVLTATGTGVAARGPVLAARTKQVTPGGHGDLVDDELSIAWSWLQPSGQPDPLTG